MPLQDASGLTTLFNERSIFYGLDHRAMDDIVGAYFGQLPDEFEDYFHEDMHVHLINMIRLSWDDLTTMAAKVFPIYVQADNDKPTAKARAEKLEQIAYGYNEAAQRVGGVSMKLLMSVLSWWMIGTANAVALCLPNYERKTPFFTFRDPRTFYPPVGWTPYVQSLPGDAMFAYQMTLGQLKRQFPEHADEIGSKLTKSSYGYGGFNGYRGKANDDNQSFWVVEYYEADTWITAVVGDQQVILNRSDTGDRGHPDVMPVVPMGMYSPAGSKGRSMFADQLSIQAAMARMFSQKLDYFDRTLYQMIFHTPVSGNTIKMGPYATNEYVTTTGVQPRVDTIAPAHPIDADQMLQITMGLSRMLNRNPEQFQGAGEADSAKALQELKSGITTTIRDGIWPPIVEAIPKLYTIAAKLDLKLWPHERKLVVGTAKNRAFRTNYTPRTDLFEREETFTVEPGLGLAGYQGTVEILQLLGAESISEDTALEQLEHVRDPQAEKRRIFMDRLQKLQFADLASKAQAGMLQPGALEAIKEGVAKGEDPWAVAAALDRAGQLTVQPQMDPMAAMMGGGGEELGPTSPMPAPAPGAISKLAIMGRR